MTMTDQFQLTDDQLAIQDMARCVFQDPSRLRRHRPYCIGLGHAVLQRRSRVCRIAGKDAHRRRRIQRRQRRIELAGPLMGYG